LFVRAFATAVTVYSIALVIELITGLSFFWSVVLLGVFTVVYDIFGGIRGVIYSDVLQLLLLAAMLVVLLITLSSDAGGILAMFGSFPEERRTAVDLAHHGFGDGQTFALWPMLFGGLFLYVSYYGCDQSQVQRTLSTEGIDDTNRALFLNGILRFPLVALYCAVGVGIGVYAVNHPEFLNTLPNDGETKQFNLAVPLYMLSALPSGVVGLAMVALFAAAMSSLDSVINSLSATTMEDFVRRFHKGQWSDTKELLLSRWLTVFWGVVTLTLSFFVGDIAPTVLEAINKIGSLANGPILAVFVLGFFVRRVGGTLAVIGLLSGILLNAYCWIALPTISWLWWNPLGFAVGFFIPWLLSYIPGMPLGHDDSDIHVDFDGHAWLAKESVLNWRLRSGWLVVWFMGLLALLLVL
jgi:SSS family transporter